MTLLSARIRVMLVDDEMPVRDAYARWLETDGRAIVVGEAENQAEAADRLAELVASPATRPDVIVLDLGLPATSGSPIDFRGGLAAIPRLKEASPASRVLVVTQGTDADAIVEAVALGADGYVWKNETGDAIATAIEKVHEGKLVCTVSVAERMLGRLEARLADRPFAILARKKRHRRLSDVLYRTMKLYCYDGLSAREIAEREHISVDGAQSRIKTAKQVLGASTRHEAFRIMSGISEDTT